MSEALRTLVWVMISQVFLFSASADAGINQWTTNDPSSSITFYALATTQAVPNTIYAGGSGGALFKSTNAGTTWSGIAPLPATVFVLLSDPAAPNTIYAGTNGAGVFKSTNGGSSWTPINTGITDLRILAIALDPTTPNTIYIGTGDVVSASGGGIFESTDGENNWIQSGLSGKTVLSIGISTGIVYAGTGGGGVFDNEIFHTVTFQAAANGTAVRR